MMPALHARPPAEDVQLAETRCAFDSVAPDYDGPRGNNALIQRMRERLQARVEAVTPRGGRLLDLGCGTGIDAAHFAQEGYRVLAVDWSPAMVARTRDRAAQRGLDDRLEAANVGAQELDRLRGERFDTIYSDLGPLNCAPDMDAVARACADLLPPGSKMVFSVIGRHCPWEFVHYAARRKWSRARVRASAGMVPVGLNGHTIWARYYTPGEFYRSFRPYFALGDLRALCLFLPPPYLLAFCERHPRLAGLLGRLEDRLGGAPLIRSVGDHFLMTLVRRDSR